jgi:hypothetical protein
MARVEQDAMLMQRRFKPGADKIGAEFEAISESSWGIRKSFTHIFRLEGVNHDV